MPDLLKLMDEIEAGNVKTLVIKDMSRIGRDYLCVGLLMEKLREKNVWLIYLDVATSQMAQRGIRTDRGNRNRKIKTDNQLLRETKARLNKLKNG